MDLYAIHGELEERIEALEGEVARSRAAIVPPIRGRPVSASARMAARGGVGGGRVAAQQGEGLAVVFQQPVVFAREGVGQRVPHGRWLTGRPGP